MIDPAPNLPRKPVAADRGPLQYLASDLDALRGEVKACALLRVPLTPSAVAMTDPAWWSNCVSGNIHRLARARERLRDVRAALRGAVYQPSETATRVGILIDRLIREWLPMLKAGPWADGEAEALGTLIDELEKCAEIVRQAAATEWEMRTTAQASIEEQKSSGIPIASGIPLKPWTASQLRLPTWLRGNILPRDFAEPLEQIFVEHAYPLPLANLLATTQLAQGAIGALLLLRRDHDTVQGTMHPEVFVSNVLFLLRMVSDELLMLAPPTQMAVVNTRLDRLIDCTRTTLELLMSENLDQIWCRDPACKKGGRHLFPGPWVEAMKRGQTASGDVAQLSTFVQHWNSQPAAPSGTETLTRLAPAAPAVDPGVIDRAAERAAVMAVEAMRSQETRVPSRTKLQKLQVHDRQAWQLATLQGMTQAKVAAALNREHGTSYTQGQVSRMIDRVKAHADANGLSEKIEGPIKRPRTVDPGKLELGARVDKRKPRPSDMSRSNDDDE